MTRLSRPLAPELSRGRRALAWLPAALLPAAPLACTNTEDPPAIAGTPGSPGPGTPFAPWPAQLPEFPPDTPELEFLPIGLPGVGAATDFAFLPGGRGDVLVSSHDGGLHLLRIRSDAATYVAGARLSVFRDEGCGLLTIALDPEFEANGFIYLTRCVNTRQSALTRHVFDASTVLAPGEVDILRVTTDRDPPEDWHRFGSLGFEPDGETLWVLLGDHFLREHAQDPSTPFGSLLRIRPNRASDGSGHAPAPDNSSGVAGADPRVYAYGLRSPWRATRDRHGRFFVGDVGEYSREEVDLVTSAGQNFGWPRYEGPCESGCQSFVNPIASYGRASDDPYVFDDPDTDPETRRAVWVGDAYAGGATDRYYGLFDDAVPFGDFYAGWVRLLAVDESGALASDRFVGHLTDISAWHTGPDGYMYALTLDGRLHRAVQVIPAP